MKRNIAIALAFGLIGLAVGFAVAGLMSQRYSIVTGDNGTVVVEFKVDSWTGRTWSTHKVEWFPTKMARPPRPD